MNLCIKIIYKIHVCKISRNGLKITFLLSVKSSNVVVSFSNVQKRICVKRGIKTFLK